MGSGCSCWPRSRRNCLRSQGGTGRRHGRPGPHHPRRCLRAGRGSCNTTGGHGKGPSGAGLGRCGRGWAAVGGVSGPGLRVSESWPGRRRVLPPLPARGSRAVRAGCTHACGGCAPHPLQLPAWNTPDLPGRRPSPLPPLRSSLRPEA